MKMKQSARKQEVDVAEKGAVLKGGQNSKK
jgi:hypothetical protein